MPYTYDDYLSNSTASRAQADRTSAAQPGLGSSTQSTFIGRGPGTTTYTAGMTNREFVRENLGVGGGRNSYENMAMGMLNPVGGVVQGVKAYGHYKKARAAERADTEARTRHLERARGRAGAEWLQTVDPTSRTAVAAQAGADKGKYLSDDTVNQMLRQDHQAKQRTGYEKQVEDYFNDPARASWQQGIVQNRLQNDLADVQEDFGNNMTSSVQGAASRGLKGGSVDMENRGAVARTRDTQTVQAASRANSTRDGLRSQDQNQRNQLLGLVNSGDIGDSDSIRSALEGIHNQTTAQGADYAGQQQRRQLDQFGRQQQSQAWGQGLGALSGSIDQNPQRASSLGAWFSNSGTSRGGW